MLRSPRLCSFRDHRSRGWRGIAILGVVAVGAVTFAACASSSDAGATRGSTFPPNPPPATFREVPRPQGASSSPGATHWYRAPNGDGHAVELGVYLPEKASTTPPRTVLVLPGADGLRRRYEDVARGFAERGDVGIVGCWFDDPAAPLGQDAVSCSGGPIFTGTDQAGVASLDTLIAAVGQVPLAPLAPTPATVDLGRLAIAGHSYGAAVALVRAATGGHREPIVASSGLYKNDPNVGPPRAGDRYPTDLVRGIDGPVQVLHGAADNIVAITIAHDFVAALGRAGNVPAFEEFPAPADHSFPFSDGAFPGAPPGTTFAKKYLADAGAWIDAHLP